MPEWWLLNVAALRTGTVLLPGTTLLTADDIAARIHKSESDCVIGDADVATKVRHKDTACVVSKLLSPEMVQIHRLIKVNNQIGIIVQHSKRF